MGGKDIWLAFLLERQYTDLFLCGERERGDDSPHPPTPSPSPFLSSTALHWLFPGENGLDLIPDKALTVCFHLNTPTNLIHIAASVNPAPADIEATSVLFRNLSAPNYHDPAHMQHCLSLDSPVFRSRILPVSVAEGGGGVFCPCGHISRAVIYTHTHSHTPPTRTHTPLTTPHTPTHTLTPPHAHTLH